MKIKLFFLSLFLACKVGAQNDTLQVDQFRDAAKIIFSQLDTALFEGRLLDYALPNNELILKQIRGHYKQVHNSFTLLNLYTDVYRAYVDSTAIKTPIDLVTDINDYFEEFQLTDYDAEDDPILKQPFGIILQDLYMIDTIKLEDGSVNFSSNVVTPQVDESTLYKKVILKSSALLEFHNNEDFKRGAIKYDERFISTSENITIDEIKINVGNGFEILDQQNNEIEYFRNVDSLVAQAILHYYVDTTLVIDTLDFQLTNDVDDRSSDRSISVFDDRGRYNGVEMDFRYGIVYGCFNGEKIRRPVIFVPPYSPGTEPKTLRGYYKQFNTAGLMDELYDKGYDVIILRQIPSNPSLFRGGRELANYIWQINQEKRNNYPNEYWENILIGYSTGGQHIRYALKYIEDKHMNEGLPHHHSRLYMSFDSPHHGANTPFFAQTVYYELSRTLNTLALLPFNSLNDDASRGLNLQHIDASTIINSSNNNDTYVIDPKIKPDRQDFLEDLTNEFLHLYSHYGDTRRTFPSFSRNVAISTGSFNTDYEDEYSLTPELKLFEQNAPLAGFTPAPYTGSRKAAIYSSKYPFGISFPKVFDRNELRLYGGVIPSTIKRFYRIENTADFYEWDLAQGGHKTLFYDGFFVVPIGATSLLRASTLGIGTKNYTSEISFLPMQSAFALNPIIWENNNLFYNPQDEGLMYQKFDFSIGIDESNHFGYPHLGRPNDHFNVTPFEAIYIDAQTYEHIKLEESVDPDNIEYLDSIRVFMMKEIEDDVVGLQNKVIGQNHINWDPNYEYEAWYKADVEVRIGNNVTPKTNPGDYIIEETGNITVYARERVVIKPGFHAQQGSKFRATIFGATCSVSGPRSTTEGGNTGQKKQQYFNDTQTTKGLNISENELAFKIIPNPNRGSFQVKIPPSLVGGKLTLFDTFGKKLYIRMLNEMVTLHQTDFESGIYHVMIQRGGVQQTQKLIIK